MLTFLGASPPPLPATELIDALRIGIFCSKDSMDEAALIAQETRHAFQGYVSVFININSAGLDSAGLTSAVFLLTNEVSKDKNVSDMITLTEKCKQLTVEVNCPDVTKFEFKNLSEKFNKLQQIGGQIITAHKNTSIVKIQLEVIWGKLQLVTPDKMFPVLARIDNVYDEVKVKASEFVEGTGKWFFEEIDKRIERGDKTVVLEGTAGLGKSVLLAELCARSFSLQGTARPARQDQFSTVALHFFKHDDANLNSARIMIGSIARQLAGKVNGYSMALNIFLESCNENQLENLTTLFTASILEPAKAVGGDDGDCVLVVLDALDECKDWKDLLKVLDELWPQMPKRFVLVASTRPADATFSPGKLSQLLIKCEESKTSKDIAIFVAYKLRRGACKAVSGDAFEEALKVVAKEVAERANGLFLYAALVCLDLEKCETLEELEAKAKELPSGMNEYYIRFFADFKKSFWGENSSFYMAALAPILAARVPLPVAVWKQAFLLVFGTEQTCSRLGALVAKDKLDDKMKEVLQRLLDFSGGTVKVLHKSMDDFLRSSDEAKDHSLLVDISVGHELIATRAKSFMFLNPTWKPLNSDEERFYGAHSLYHLTEAGMLEGASKQVLGIGKLMRLIWAAKQDSSFARLIRDVQALLQVAEDPKIKFALSLLNLSEKAVMNDPREFAGQVLGRVMIAPFLEVQLFWIKQAQEWTERASVKGQLEIMVPMCFGRSGLQPAGTSLVKILEGHTNGVTAVAISPDSRFIVTGSDDSTMRIWDFATGEETLVLEGHTGLVTSMAIFPDSSLIVTGSRDNTARVWNAQTGENKWILKGHTEWVTSIAVSPDFKFIVTGSVDCTARVWYFATGKEKMVLTGHSGWVTSVAVSPDSKLLVTGSADGTARVWYFATGKKKQVLKGHIGAVSSVAISPDSRFIVTGSRDNTVRVWDFEKSTKTRVLGGHTRPVTSVAIFSDSRFVATGSEDKTTRVWDFASGKEMRVFEGHTAWVNSVAISPDSKFIVTGSSDKTARVWDFKTYEENRVLKGHAKEVTSVAISPDSRFVVTGSVDKTARVWDFANGEERMVLAGHSRWVTSVTISPDSKLIVTGSYDKTARVWDAQTGKEKRALKGHTEKVTSAAISPDSKFIVTGSLDNTVRVWYLAIGEEKELKGHAEWVRSVAISPDSRFILSIDYEQNKVLWEVETGLQSQLDPHECGFALQTADGSVVLGGPNTVGCTQDSFADMQRVGSAVFGERENGYECWTLSTQSQCLLAVADSHPLVEPTAELATEPTVEPITAPTTELLPSDHLDSRPDDPQFSFFHRSGHFVYVAAFLFAVFMGRHALGFGTGPLGERLNWRNLFRFVRQFRLRVVL